MSREDFLRDSIFVIAFLKNIEFFKIVKTQISSKQPRVDQTFETAGAIVASFLTGSDFFWPDIWPYQDFFHQISNGVMAFFDQISDGVMTFFDQISDGVMTFLTRFLKWSWFFDQISDEVMTFFCLMGSWLFWPDFWRGHDYFDQISDGVMTFSTAEKINLTDPVFWLILILHSLLKF